MNRAPGLQIDDPEDSHGKVLIARSEKIDPEDVPVRRALVFRPARMNPGVATVERAVVPDQAVRVGIVFRELHGLDGSAGLDFVPDEAGAFVGPTVFFLLLSEGQLPM